jgi:hypothetical protein
MLFSWPPRISSFVDHIVSLWAVNFLLGSSLIKINSHQLKQYYLQLFLLQLSFHLKSTRFLMATFEFSAEANQKLLAGSGDFSFDQTPHLLGARQRSPSNFGSSQQKTN